MAVYLALFIIQFFFFTIFSHGVSCHFQSDGVSPDTPDTPSRTPMELMCP